jgi:hypothetical protein
MLFTKLKSAVLVLVTAGILVAAGAGVYGYQASRPQPSSGLPPIAEDVSDDSTPGVSSPEQTEPAPLPEKSDRAEQDLAYATKIVALARAAREQQEDGNLNAASEATHQIEALAREWSGMLRHSAASKKPPLFKKKPSRVYVYPKRENALGPGNATETLPVTPGASRTRPPELSPPPMLPGVAPAAPAAEAPPAPVAPIAPGAVPAPPAPPSDVDRRLDEVERRIDQLLRTLREEGRSDASPRRRPDKQ